MERLDKILASTGKWSRKEAKALVKSGRVKVEGVIPARPEDKVAEGALVTVDGHPICTEKYIYVMLHKPAGVVSSTEDPREKTVLHLLPKELQRVGLFPVGRLDKDTEGLLLLTNDGLLAHRLLAPGKHVDKVYYVEVDGALEPEDAAAFQVGITLADGTECLPADLELLPRRDQCLVTLREGKYHQVKRMLASRGKPVVYLKRLSIGPLELDRGLPPGRWRVLTPGEKASLGCGQ
ncbi:MAG: pseudouridine synthase [Ruminiclostridium sp.]|nr:pseudouridine synthase [Ruminiclostridium sp.]